MKKLWIISIIIGLIAVTCSNDRNILPDVPSGAQAISLFEAPLYPADPDSSTMEKLNQAKQNYLDESKNIDNIIWYGRRTAYSGDYREAIRIYTRGIKLFPDESCLYRHRGHRYISIREFECAIIDFETAAALIQGREDEIEPDGMPNALNIPVSTLHTNIWYHLGLAYYLNNDLENALRVYQKGIEAYVNDDNIVSLTHWLYMTLRRLNREEEADITLIPIHADMNIIENMAYHQLCLFYKGEIPLESLTDPDFSNIMNDAVAYGIGNWFLYNGKRDKAKTVYEKILKGKSWSSFGFITAESDYHRLFKNQLDK
jgi:tetratricopeptide (TPR) repeat protein